MGTIYADIELINADDLALVRRNIIDKDEVRHMVVKMLADSGAYMMAINENIQAQLELPFIEKRKSVMADGSIAEHDVVGPIIVKFKNRTATCSALVLQGNSEPLLGAIPMEEMDVILDLRRQEMIVNPEHPYYAQLSLKGGIKPLYENL
jgi:clan AA aspartic protease